MKNFDVGNVGRLCCLMAADSYYRNFILSDINRMILPPVELGQFLLFKRAEAVTGFLTYAFVSKEVESDILLADRRIQTEHWNSGDRVWIVDTIISSGDLYSIRKQLFKAFQQFEEVRYIRRDEYQNMKRINRFVRTGTRFKKSHIGK